ncbi:MAG: hypothetical protein R3B49_05655 [Phycisphaerales bacterium]
MYPAISGIRYACPQSCGWCHECRFWRANHRKKSPKNPSASNAVIVSPAGVNGAIRELGARDSGGLVVETAVVIAGGEIGVRGVGLRRR